LNYLVSINIRGASVPQAEQAINRYCSVLESRLGGVEGVVATYRIWERVQAAGASDCSERERQAVCDWQAAHEEGRRAGSLVLGREPAEYFTLRVVPDLFGTAASARK
jgi:hypothetical protein